VPGPCIYEQHDAYAIVEGPLKKIELSATEYIICTDPKTGLKVVVEGPVMYMPKPYELVGGVLKKVSILNNQFVNVVDTANGHMKIVAGPSTFALGVFERADAIQFKVELSATQYVICTDGKTGEKRIVEGPVLYTPLNYEQFSQPLNKINLRNNQYCHVKKLETGALVMVEGPKVFALSPFEEASKIYDCLSLNFSQYSLIVNTITGVIRIEKGPAKVLLIPFEEYMKDIDGNTVRNALTADANNAIHIRDVVTGKEELIIENKIYFPSSPNIKVMGLRPLIKLAPYERMVMMDRESNLIFKSGEESPGFFLPPFCKIMSQNWTSQKGAREVSVFDTRFDESDFNFGVRTNDNVEVFMRVNVYWKIKDFEKMIKATNDPPLDICNQIRSQILNIASKMATKDLMEYSSMDLVTKIHDEDTDFWLIRGMQIIRINITEKRCADPDVDKTYRAVIEQKIIRVKNLEAQRGENDKKIAEIEGNILFESENFKLLEKKMANVQMENETHGRAEGERIHMFFEGLGKALTIEEKMKIFLELQRTERIKMVTTKVDQLYVTPTDVDFQLHKIDNGRNDDVKMNINLEGGNRKGK
jgi:regulator of protease activity HflC (stomatin/prohibitin superfamily)